MKLFDNITEVVGNTPLVRLNRVIPSGGAHVYAKLEFYNPTSSVKDRIAIAMVDEAERSGKLKPGGVLIEATSGNTGIALAMVGAARGYKVILTMPESMSKERRALLRAFGAELILTPAALGMNGAVSKAVELAESFTSGEGVYLQQFENLANPKIHSDTTAMEIWEDTEGMVKAFVAGIGTGGTITGVSRVLREKSSEIKVYAVEPEASPILNGGTPGPHVIQGIGANFIPEILNRESYDEVIDVSNDSALAMARRVAKEEGILVGISGGAAIEAACRVALKPELKDQIVVVIVASFGERYLSTVLYSDLMD